MRNIMKTLMGGVALAVMSLSTSAAFAQDKVFTSPQTNLALFEETAPTITLEEVEREFRDAGEGIEGPAL